MAWLVWTIGLVAAAGGAAVCLWALLWDRARGRARCPRCWYDLTLLAGGTGAGATRRDGETGGAGGVCPECGRGWRRAGELRRTRLRWRIAAAGAAVVVASGWIAPTLAMKSWVALVPQPALDMVISMFFAEEAEKPTAPAPTGAWALAGAVGGGGPGGAAATGQSSWENALLSWRLKRDLRGLMGLPDGDITALRSGYTILGDAAALIQAAPAYERRGLADALGRVALEGRSIGLRSMAFSYLINVREIARRHSGWLWRAARQEESWPVGCDIAAALFAANGGGRWNADGPRVAGWLDRVLSQEGMTAAVRYGLHRAAIEGVPPLIELVEADIGRAHAGADLEISIKLLARRRDGQAPVARLLRHESVEVRRATARALCRVYWQEEVLQGALEAARMDEDEQVRRLVAEALEFNRR